MRVLFLFLLGLLSVIEVVAQTNSTTIDDFVSLNTFSQVRVNALNPMNDGAHYTVLQDDGARIVKYSYATGAKVSVVVDIPELKETPIKAIQGYEFNHDESRLLVYVNKEMIFRNSFKADYYVIDVARREIEPLSDGAKQQAATFAPNGFSVAFMRDNNMFIKNLRFGTEAAITSDGKANEIINGIPDWVYQEEFGFVRAFEWSPNSEELAFIKFNETAVNNYSFPLYKGSFPVNDEFSLYPGEYRYKYPKAGQDNANVSVHVFNLRNRTTKVMDVDNSKEFYIPRIMWATNSDLAILKLNRRQNNLDVFVANSASGVGKVIFTNRNDKYIAPEVLENFNFLEDGRHFIFVGELDGYNHIHLFRVDGSKVNQVTKGKWDVTQYLGFDLKNKLFYFQAAAQSALKREVYSIRMDGSKITRLSPNDGTNNASFSRDFRFFINEFNNHQTPSVFSIHNVAGRQLHVLESNNVLKNKLSQYNLPAKEFFQFTTSEGVSLNGWMIKPVEFNSSYKYPVVLTQYSGPDSQRVLDSWSLGWEYFLASQGYVVVCVDGRGTAGRGEEFRKQTYMQLGKFEAEDQIETAKYVSSLSFVDNSRIGIWGWSYGGFISALCMSKSDLFKAGIAVAPVTDWRFYDTAYTERYMRLPRENPTGYSNNSPLELAANLNGRLFLIHGTADDNVHLQNTMEYSDALIQAGKQFDMFIYPNRNHALNGGNVRSHLYNMMFNYFERNLKN